MVINARNPGAGGGEEPGNSDGATGLCSILVVDDLEGNRDLLRRRLEGAGFRVFGAANGPDALNVLSREPVSLMLLDVTMPGMDGFDVLRAARDRLGEEMPPVIMLTARGAPDEVARAFELGAVDHVTKPFNLHALSARIRRHLDLSHSRATLSRRAEKLERTQYLDNLTGLYNGRGLEVEVWRCLVEPRAQGAGRSLCVMAVEDLPAVNHTFGPAAGDQVLRHVARVLQAELDQHALLARFRGDKFAILMNGQSSESEASAVQRLRDLITASPISVDGEQLWVSVSLGLAPLVASDTSVAEVIQRAEHACSFGGRGGVALAELAEYGADEIRTNLRWAMKLKRALREDRLELYAQPIVPIDQPQERPCRFEVLVRMVDGEDIVSPGLFLPASEKHGLSAELDRWVIDHALDFLSGNAGADVERININLSGQSLGSPDFLEYVKSRVSEQSVDASQICFEITETAAVTNLREVVNLIRVLQELGVAFALDDFGSGVSSFSYLRSLPVNSLKIDGQFVRQVDTSGLDQIIVKSICEMAAFMGMTTVAEFVESEEAIVSLARAGVDFLQGYHVGKPQPIASYIRPRARGA